jgi:hypothetical protein|tara:strand:- start:1533 stop:2006 length:474 start_codon:yes stop_codon:yes gene_type:complete
MSSIEDWYRKEVDEDDVFGAGICSCAQPGYHIECQWRILAIRAKFEESDKKLLKKYAVSEHYGVSKNNQEEFKLACKKLAERLQQKLEFDETKVIENESWWFIPHGWIGVLGFIVEKESDDIYIIGSRTEPEFDAYAYWHGIEWYSSGHGELYEAQT